MEELDILLRIRVDGNVICIAGNCSSRDVREERKQCIRTLNNSKTKNTTLRSTHFDSFGCTTGAIKKDTGSSIAEVATYSLQ